MVENNTETRNDYKMFCMKCKKEKIYDSLTEAGIQEKTNSYLDKKHNDNNGVECDGELNYCIATEDPFESEESKRLRLKKEQERKEKEEKEENIKNVIRKRFKEQMLFRVGNELYTWIDMEGHKEVIRVEDDEFRDFFTSQMYKLGFETDEITSMFNKIKGASYDSPRIKLYTRVVGGEKGSNKPGDNEKVIWYDLSSEDWNFIRVVPSEDGNSGWTVEKYTPIPMFYRWPHQTSQVIPEKVTIEEAIKVLTDFFDCSTGIIRLKDEKNKILYIVSLIVKFIPAMVHPNDLIVAPQGSAKSYQDEIKKSIVDPSNLPYFLPPGSADKELIQNIFHHWLYIADNCYQSFRDDVSTLFSQVATGAYASVRQLFTNDKDFMRDLSYHPLSFNGINNPITRPDLMSRTIQFEIKSIDEYGDLDELNIQFNEQKPKLLGSIFTILSKAMYIKKTMPKFVHKNRMVQFRKWGYCIAEAMNIGGNKLLDIYNEKIKVSNYDIINEDSVSKLLRYMVFDIGTGFKGTMTELHVKMYADKISYDEKIPDTKSIKTVYIKDTSDMSVSFDEPKTPVGLGMRIAEIEKALKVDGIEVKRDIVWNGSKSVRTIEIFSFLESIG